MINYPKAADIQQSIFLGKWDKIIPVYHVNTMHALNQLVGCIRHINSKNGTVLFRGQCNLYKKVTASIKHDIVTESKNWKDLINTINLILSDDALMHFFGFRNETIFGWNLYEKLIIEAAFQHYGAKTYCVDFVDNLWTALWFGLYRWDQENKKYIARLDNDKDFGREYIKFSDYMTKKVCPEKPDLSMIKLTEAEILKLRDNAAKGNLDIEILTNKVKYTKLKGEIRRWKAKCDEIKNHNDVIDKINGSSQLYLFLYVAETNKESLNGLYFGDYTYTIDLRKALPSTFLRPCAQHGWIVRGKKQEYDFNERISCVVQIDVNLVRNMLGHGILLSQENFFPSASIDQGYKILIERQVNSSISSTKYAKIIKEGMIKEYYR